MVKKSFKPFGELAIKLKNVKKRQGAPLTSKEKSELIAEGVLTIILLLLLNIAIIVLFGQIIHDSKMLSDFVFYTKQVLSQSLDTDIVYSWAKPTAISMGIIDLLILYWRLRRRYHQMQLRHIISELHYIANGHFDHRIPFALGGDLQRVAESINVLVTSTVRAIEEERKIEKSKDELITNVSHDIRTPLTSIIGYLGLIEERQHHNEEELLHYTHTAFLKAKQMKVLVDDLFEYTKVRQSSTPLNTISFDMIQLLEQIEVAFELDAKNRGLEIQVENDTTSLMMEGDTEKLVRVFNNLISNALKYGKGGTKILLSAEKIGSEAVITVKNNGEPIPEKSLDLLFNRFYRVEESRSQETGGTGLGLAIAQSIVVLHGGYIYARSDADWTSFILHLPLTQTTRKAPE